MHIEEAKERVDRLIKKGRSHFLKPIMIAELLRLHRIDDLSLEEIRDFKGVAYRETRVVAERLFHRHIDLNYGYIEGAFDHDKLSIRALKTLAAHNETAEIEYYIYRKLEERWRPFRTFIDKWRACDAHKFRIKDFICDYESIEGLGNARGKMYEVVVFSLFQAVVDASNAKITFSIDVDKAPLVAALPGFSEVFFGLPDNQLSISARARIFRAGRTHASDSGIDMWANFGPVIQVKHQSSTSTFGPKDAAKTFSAVKADRLVVICKRRNARKLAEIAELLEAKEHVRLLDEGRIIEWYEIAYSEPWRTDIGVRAHSILLEELGNEFPIPDAELVARFMSDRGYPALKRRHTP